MALTARTNRPFTILYDLRWMQLGAAGGIEQATYELVSEVSRIDRKNDYRIFAPRSASWEWDFPARFRVTRHDTARERASSLAFDLVHSTCGYIHPDMLEFRSVLTVNDLQHLAYPAFFDKADWDDRERLYRASTERARHIICISEFTRRDLHARYGVPLEKMTTVWIIPSRTVWDDVAEGSRRALLDAIGVGGPYLFYPAHSWPHKNHHALVQAFERALHALPADVTLVLTGRPLGPDHPAAAFIRERGLESRVRHLGFRSPLELRALFQGCMALVFPSLFEGFGMPVAEAIIAGKPVACSNATSLPEIAGDAAVMFDPANVDEIAACIVRIATQPQLRTELSAAARRRRHLFSARTSAVRTLAVYEKAFASAA